MVKATPAPDVTRQNWLTVPYLYAALLTGFSVYQLVAFEDYMPRVGEYVGGGQALTIIIAVGLVSMQIAALPFLLRLTMSPLARFISTLCALLVPLALLVLNAQAMLRGVVLGPTDYLLAQPLDWIALLETLPYAGLAYISFVVLHGSLRLTKDGR